MTDWLESFDEFRFSPDEFIDGGDDVVVPNHQQGRGRGSGALFQMRTTWLCTVRDARIARIREYSTKARALEAAELNELQ